MLRRLQTVISARSDFDATAIKAGRSQLFMHLQEMIKDAANRAAAAGYPVTGAAAQAGPIYWSTDWIEPGANRMTTETPTWQRLDAAPDRSVRSRHGRSGG